MGIYIYILHPFIYGYSFYPPILFLQIILTKTPYFINSQDINTYKCFSFDISEIKQLIAI